MQTKQQNYEPEQLVDRINKLAEEYKGPVEIKAGSSRKEVTYLEDYNINVNFKFPLEDMHADYSIYQKNNVRINYMSEHLTVKIPSNKVITLTRIDGAISSLIINGFVYNTNSDSAIEDSKAQDTADVCYQRINEYLQQETPEILELALKKPASRNPGLDDLIKKLELNEKKR